MAVDAQSLKKTMRQWASGVSVVTTVLGDDRGGMTVSAFNSLSLEPPTILVCLNKDASMIPMLEAAGVFGVSILNEQQVEISQRFAGQVVLAEGETRFDGVPVHTAETGVPLLSEALAWLDCRVIAKYDAGTHYIIVGEVVATAQTDGEPLVYYNRGYRQLIDLPTDTELSFSSLITPRPNPTAAGDNKRG
jgi:flavin reductase (DIM6/NTAB) family NADH-FMN oxidoreductase RutF